ncbi:MAG TPA: PilZ domain-containing protein [Pyrinomonadaceae bacterium]|jgi:hypothetical protein
MAELLRALAARLHRYIGDRRRAPRHGVRLAVTLWLPDGPLNSNGVRRRSPVLEGFTRDVSATGLALILPAIRIGEHYLIGEGRNLRLRLELPTGAIQMDVTPVRYERLEEEQAEKGYLIGVLIAEMSDEDRQRYNEGMKTVDSSQ